MLDRRRAVCLALLALDPLSRVLRVIVHRGAYQADGLPVGWDFAVLLTGARVLELDPARLYDFGFQSFVEHAWRPLPYLSFPFISPPLVAAVLRPLAHVPYPVAYGLWLAASVAVAQVALGWLTPRPTLFDRALCVVFYPFSFAFAAGQVSVFAFALVAAMYRFVTRERWASAGLSVAALAGVKPQLVIGLLVYAAVRIRRTGFWAAFALGVLVLLGATWLVSPVALRSYAHLVTDVLPHFEVDRFPLAGMATWRGFFSLALPDHRGAALVLAAITVATGALFALRAWRRPLPEDAAFALAVWLTLWCAPHGYLYDWTLLAAPIVLAGARKRGDDEALLRLVMVIAVVLLVSEALAEVVLGVVGRTFQPALVLLAILPVASRRFFETTTSTSGGR